MDENHRTNGPTDLRTHGPRDPRTQGPTDPGTHGPGDPRTHWERERDFWTGDADFYRQHLSDDSLMLFPGMVLTKPETVASIEAAPRWADVSLEDRRELHPSDDVVILVYTATAQREGDAAPYRAIASSVYVRRGGAWLLILHQQSPQP